VQNNQVEVFLRFVCFLVRLQTARAKDFATNTPETIADRLFQADNPLREN